MKKNEYIDYLIGINQDEELIAKVINKYGNVPNLVKKIISSSKQDIHFEDSGRVLSEYEILNLSSEYDVEYNDVPFIPLIDLFDNDYICFDLMNNKWFILNILDNVAFSNNDNLQNLLS